MSWLEEIKTEGRLQSTADEQAYFVSCLLLGDYGAGKTCLASTFPNPLLLNYDQGQATITALKKDIPYVNFPAQSKVYKRTLEILRDARDRTGPFGPDGELAHIETLIIDSVSALGKAILYEVLTLESKIDPTKGKPEFDHWAFQGARLEQLFNILREVPMHIVVTATLKLEEDSETKTLVGSADIPGSFRARVGGYFDEVYVMNARKGRAGETETVYETHTVRFKFWTAKSRWRLPSTIVNMEFSHLDKLLKKARIEGVNLPLPTVAEIADHEREEAIEILRQNGLPEEAMTLGGTSRRGARL